MKRKIPTNFEAFAYEELTPTDNPHIYKTRVRAFYKYANRNGSYITDEIADKLISNVAGLPVVGFYNKSEEDFEGHSSPEINKAYGFVAFPPNIAWEKHNDSDGIERDYACFDVWLWIEYYEEANKIIGKAQSMELEESSIEGEWADFKEGEYFVFTNASLRGLCILGDGHEPCFQGAAFFEVNQPTISQFMLAVQEIVKNTLSENKKNENQEAKKTMIVSVKNIDNENYSKVFTVLNPDFTEDNNYPIEEVIISMEQDTVTSFSIEAQTKKTYVYSFNKDGEVVLQQTLEVDYLNDKYSDYEEKAIEIARVIGEYETLKEAFEKKEEENATLNGQLTAAFEKIADYEALQVKAEETRKTELLDSYKKLLKEETMAAIAEEVPVLSFDELEAKLAVTFARAQVATNFENQKRIPTVNDKNPTDNLNSILQKYVK